MINGRSLSVWCLVVAANTFATVACKSESNTDNAKSASHDKDGGRAIPPGVDPDIAAAVSQVAKAPPGVTAGEKAPPPKGVFAPGEGDKEIAAGAAPKLTLGNAGSAPKLSLRPIAFASTLKRDAMATLSIRTGPRAALPTVDLVVAFTTSAPKADDKAARDKAPLEVQGRVTSSKLSAEQPGRLPPGLDRAAKTLEGSRILYRLMPGGGLTNLQLEPKAGAEEGLLRVLQSFAEFLPAIHGPYPNEPVGVGAFWMLTSRETIAGVDTVTYRMMRVEQIDGTRAVLSIGSKRYSAGSSVAMAGLPPHTIEQFQCEGNGRLVVDSTTTAHEAHLEEALLASLAPQNEPVKRLSLQLQAIADLGFTASH